MVKSEPSEAKKPGAVSIQRGLPAAIKYIVVLVAVAIAASEIFTLAPSPKKQGSTEIAAPSARPAPAERLAPAPDDEVSFARRTPRKESSRVESPEAASPPQAPSDPSSLPHGRETKFPEGLRVQSTWGDTRTLTLHFRDHGKDFASTSPFHYAAQAARFFREAPFKKLPTKVDDEGVIRIYDPATNSFGAYNPDGTTRTFFKPERGRQYWEEQPGNAPWTP
jgi:hypothetical protein